MVCVSTQTGKCLVLDKGSRSMDGPCPESPKSTLGEKELCWYIRGMCMELRCVYCVCRGMGYILLNVGLLTSFQSQDEYAHDPS